MIKKILISDYISVNIVDKAFSGAVDTGIETLLGVYGYTIQIYCDFSGYSDIAIGTSRLFGFNLKQNFAFPYFSRDIAEFWRRWHISLSTWFRDYLYIPLGGSRGSKIIQVRNVFIIFIVSGFWHGANWTFIVWGGLHALLFIPSVLTKNNRKFTEDLQLNRYLLPSIGDVFRILSTFVVVSFCWVFFRADSLNVAFLKQTIC